MPGPEDLSFDLVSAVHETGDPGVFGADIHPLWAVGDKANGGYLLAILGRAARTVAQGAGDAGSAGWEVVSSSVTYLRAPQAGPATVRTTLLRSGRTAAHVRAVLVQGDADVVDAVFVLADLPDETSVRYDGTPAFHAADPEECIRLTPKTPDRGLRRHHGRARHPARSRHRALRRDASGARDGG